MSGEITGELIKSAISKNINQNITLPDGSLFKIYKEKTVQGMKKPSFFIWIMDVGQRKLMLNNYERSYMMNIRFHADDDVENLFEYLTAIGNQLLESLAILQVPILISENVEQNKPVIGNQISFNIVEDVLQFYVTYTIKAKQVLSKTPEMRVLNIEEI